MTRFTERAQGKSLVKAFGGFADGCNEVNPDSEQTEPAKPQGLKVSFWERGANPRRIAPSAFVFYVKKGRPFLFCCLAKMRMPAAFECDAAEYESLSCIAIYFKL